MDTVQKFVEKGERMNTGEKVKAYCKENGITIARFAQSCDLSPMVIYLWATGKRDPKTGSLRKLAKGTGLPASYWLEDVA